MSQVVVYPIMDNLLKIVTGIELSTGQVFATFSEFVEWCSLEKRNAFTDNLIWLQSLLEIQGTAKYKASKHYIRVEKTKIYSIHAWRVDLERGEDPAEKLAAVSNDLTSSPAMSAVRKFSKRTHRKDAAKLLLGEVLLSVREGPEWERNFSPAYRGGLTACAAVPGKLYTDVQSYDISSAYASAFVSGQYPVGESVEVEVDGLSMGDNGSIGGIGNRGYIARFRVVNARRKSWVRLACIQPDLDFPHLFADCEFDQLGMVSGTFEMAACPPEMALLQLQYEYDSIEILECYTHEMGKLTAPAIAVFEDMYKAKQDGGQLEKVQLNALTGAFGRSPLAMLGRPVTDLETAAKHLSVYNGKEGKNPVSMGTIRTWDQRWAVYTCSTVRLLLGRFEKALYDRGCEVLYCDTDSIKFLGDCGDLFDKYNASVMEFIGCGKLGSWDNESTDFSKVIFYGKKQYLHMKGEEGSITPCIAGVHKETAKDSLRGLVIEDLEGQDVDVAAAYWQVIRVSHEILGLPMAARKHWLIYTLTV